MRYSFSLLLSLLLSTSVFGQAVETGLKALRKAESGAARRIADEKAQPGFVVEILVLEGKGADALALQGKFKYVEAPARAAVAPPILPSPKNASSDADQLTAATVASQDADQLRQLLVSGGRSVLAAPKLSVLPGQPAKVQIQSEQYFTYLEPLGDDKFKSKQTGPHNLGIVLDLSVDEIASEKEAVELSSLQIEVSGLDGREPVEGLDLDVGRPIISTRSLKTSAKMRINELRLIPIPSGPESEVVLAIVIRRLEE